MIAIPTQFGPYRLNWLIGRGGMGEVHNAFDERHNRYVALKLLSAEVSADGELSARFRREARIVAMLRHPHVVPVHSFGEIDGRFYLDMRLIEGADLATILDAGNLSPERAVAIIEQVAGALAAAHDEGLVHRDVKPSNVLISRHSGSTEYAYLVDFGIARSVDAPALTRDDFPVGTLAYMAPERFRGGPPATAGDIYALACLLFECLTAQRPFTVSSLPDLLYAHLEAPPPSPSLATPTVSSAFDEVIARGMAKDPARRYRTTTELAVAAREALTADIPPARARRRRTRRSRTVLVASVVAALAASSAFGVAVLRRGNTPAAGLTVLAENSVGLLDPVTGTVTRSVGVDAGPGAAVAGFGAIWTANTDADTVSRIDPTTDSVTRIVVQSAPSAIAVGAGAVWATNAGSGTVTRIDPATDRTESIAVGTAPGGVAVARDSVWVANTGDGTLSRIDPAKNRVVDTIPVGSGPGAIAAGADIWVANSASNTVSRIDARRDAVMQTIPVGNDPEGVGVVGDTVWVANNLDGTISRIAIGDHAVSARVKVGTGSQPTGFTETAGTLWVVAQHAQAIDGIDLSGSRPRVVRTVRLGVVPGGVTSTSHGLWVTGTVDPPRHRGGTIRLRAQDPGSIDPSFVGTASTPGLLSGSYDGLVGLRHAAGSRGTEIVPDLATALPAPTQGGHTYEFRLRSGIRWSDGRELTVFDVRRGFERAIASGLLDLQGEIVGAARCTVVACDISGIVADPATRTVTFHLVRANAEFLDHIVFCPAVPATTPLAEQTVTPVPATGPYQISTYVPGRAIVLTRNPYFAPWSAAAQPAGYPDRIEFDSAPGDGAPVTRAESEREIDETDTGHADWVDARFAGPVAELRAGLGDRLHLAPDGATRGVVLNTRLPPFNDVRVRRALSFAVDRASAAAAWPSAAVPTCQVLPPDFPGYRPYCPFTLHPDSSGSWGAPDFATAERLVAASGTRGAKVTVWSLPNPAPGVNVVVKALRDLGYRVDFEVGDVAGDYFAYVADSRHQVQASFLGWSSDDPSPRGFIPPLFACDSFSPADPHNTNSSGFCDSATDALIGRAERLESTSPQAADEAWARVDEHVTDAAPWISLVNTTWVDVVSLRVRDYLRNPLLGVLFDQMWVVN